MTQLPDDIHNRRSYLKRLGITAAALGGLSTPVAASGDDTLALTPGFFSVYGSVNDHPDGPADFFFPDDPFLSDPNPIPTERGPVPLFDSSGIRISPNRNTLHHRLQVFAGLVMKDDPKPYTLVNEGGGLFEARGQTINFTARSMEEINSLVEDLPIDLPAESPIPLLADERWRAVATERIKVDLSGDPPFDYEWAATRVDIYSRGGGAPEHTLSLIYVLWAGGEESDLRENAERYAEELITSGRLNMGGQQSSARGNRP